MIVTAKCGHSVIIIPNPNRLPGSYTEEEIEIISRQSIKHTESIECGDCRYDHIFEIDCRQTVALETIATVLMNLHAKQEVAEPEKPPTEKPRCTCDDNPCTCRLAGASSFTDLINDQSRAIKLCPTCRNSGTCDCDIHPPEPASEPRICRAVIGDGYTCTLPEGHTSQCGVGRAGDFPPCPGCRALPQIVPHAKWCYLS